VQAAIIHRLSMEGVYIPPAVLPSASQTVVFDTNESYGELCMGSELSMGSLEGGYIPPSVLPSASQTIVFDTNESYGELCMGSELSMGSLETMMDPPIIIHSTDVAPDEAAHTSATIMDPRRFLMGPFQLNSTFPAEPFTDELEPTSDTAVGDAVADEFIPNKRPRRAAAIIAEKRVADVLQWEQCKESSKMFKHVDTLINTEFDRVARGTRRHIGGNVHIPVSTRPDDDVGSSTQPSLIDPTVMFLNSPVSTRVVENVSDDEGAADVDCPVVDIYNDNDDDLKNDEDDMGSLASFVVSDSHMSGNGDVSDPETVHDDSESESDSGSDGSFTCTDTASECDGSLRGDDENQ
jgi:hypothetical protein